MFYRLPTVATFELKHIAYTGGEYGVLLSKYDDIIIQPIIINMYYEHIYN